MRRWFWCMIAVMGVTVAAMTTVAQDEEAAPEADAPAATAKAEVPPPVSAGVGEKDSAIENLKLKFRQGGMTMWALLILSLAGVAFALERVAVLRKGAVAPSDFSEKANELWKGGKFDELKEMCESRPSTIARIVSFVVEHRDANLSDVAEGAADITRREFRRHNRRAYPLAVVGTLSPLMGLMGTVFGLMESFEAVAVAGTMDDPSILASSIAKALVTTATGLIIAVPALVAYHIFKSRTGDLLDLLDEDVTALMNNWFLKK